MFSRNAVIGLVSAVVVLALALGLLALLHTSDDSALGLPTGVGDHAHALAAHPVALPHERD